MSTTFSPKPNPSPTPVELSVSDPLIPPLEHGGRMSRAEFERRYSAMPNLKKAELIEGVVYVASPVRIGQHGRPNAVIVWLLVQYAFDTPGVDFADNSTVRVDDKNSPQPDAMLLVEKSKGGQTVIDADDYVASAPELVVEIAASSIRYDPALKKELYRRAGVREYVIWRVTDKAFDWFVLRDGAYEPMNADADGVYKSECFPGLWLNAPALIARQNHAVLATLRQGLATPEHVAFVERLAEIERCG